jgi:hypothetical protein
VLALASTNAFAQGSTSLSGVVVDEAGGAVPGATVVVKNNGTGVTFEQVSNSVGRFSFPSLDVGTYTVTVSLSGFKTFVANNVRLLAATPGDITATLSIGNLTETVEVTARTELIQSTQTAVRSTLSVEQLTSLPLNSRNALYAVALLPGVSTTGGPRGAIINGLPNNVVNITIDGIGTGNMLQSTDGFFSMVTPRMDAVEEITVTGAVPGAGSGAGSVQVQFVTRSGSNQFNSSVYHYYRGPKLNTNYFFNEVNSLPRNEVIVHQYGGRAGGPIILPGMFDGRGKAFFFFNFEHLHQPTSVTRTRTFIRESAQAGIFNYVVGGQTRSVDLMAIAAAAGQVSTFDPTVQALLTQIRNSTTNTGKVNDLGNANTLQFVFQSPSVGDQYSPTQRVDVNLSPRHRLSGSYWLQRFTSSADLLNTRDSVFPGLPNFGTQNSWRTTGNSTLRSTLSSNMINELRGGWQWSPNDFFANITREQFANQDFHALVFPLGNSPTVDATPQPRNTTTWSVENSLSWLRGAHNFTFGGSYAGINNRQNAYTVVPQINLGFDTATDPASGLFVGANFPSATTGQLNEARALYALLTGRVTSIPATARLDTNTGNYVYNGDLARKSGQKLFAAYIQDSWQTSPTLTINAGLRWDLHMPFTPVSRTFSKATLEDLCGISGVGSGIGGRSCNLFQPGVLTGKEIPQYTLFEPGDHAYNTNWLNFGPNVGVAWRPNVQSGFMRTLLGDPEQATIRAGYSLTYNQERIDRFTANAGDNPGGTLSVTRNLTTGFPLVLPGESAPVLFRERNRLGPPDFPEAPQYPISATTANNVNIFQAELRNPRVHSYSIGVQRAVGPDMAVEVRYVGNRNLYRWAEENWNERNIIESGFLDEFKRAQGNLQAHLAQGCGQPGAPACSFAYRGIGTNTQPLPIHLAYLSGRADADNAAAYTSTSFTNTGFLARFGLLEPNVTGAASAIDTTGGRNLAAGAGRPVNLFVMNPRVGGTFIVQDRDFTKYNSLQVELRRRLSRGLLVGANYTYGISKTSSNQSLHFDRYELDNTDVPHVIKVNWIYQIPVGRGRRFGTDMNAWLDGVVGGWEFSGNTRFQTQRYRIVGARLVGMSEKELQEAFSIRQVRNETTGLINVFSFPDDIRINTHRAFATDALSPTGYSAAFGPPEGRYLAPVSSANCIAIYRFDCDTPDIHLNGPWFSRVDMRIKKLFPFLSRGSFELDFEMLNVFDTINFNHSVGFNTAEPTDTFRVTSAYTDINTTFDPGGRIGQVVWRVNW